MSSPIQTWDDLLPVIEPIEEIHNMNNVNLEAIIPNVPAGYTIVPDVVLYLIVGLAVGNWVMQQIHKLRGTV